MKVIQVCHPVLCDQEPTQQLVGNKAHWFCCMKGFEQSLKEYAESVIYTPIQDEFGNLLIKK